MTQVSTLSGIRFGKRTPYFVPPTFLYRQKRGTSPHICQIAAFSQITGYRFGDWMELFGFNLGLIPSLQLRIHVERTALITPAVLTWSCTSASPLCGFPNTRYLFAKIGTEDAVAYPRIVPGSIVRADRHYSRSAFDELPTVAPLWLVEHPGGLTCCYVRRVDDRNVVLHPTRPPLDGWPLSLSNEVQVLGRVDLELRPHNPLPVRPTCRLGNSRSSSRRVPRGTTRIDFSTLVRLSRARSGLTLREAHELTKRIARLLGNRGFGIALSLLSDYEATNNLPRHVEKIMTLCVIYGLHFCDLLAAGGIHVDDYGKAPLAPDHEQRDFLLRPPWLQKTG